MKRLLLLIATLSLLLFLTACDDAIPTEETLADEPNTEYYTLQLYVDEYIELLEEIEENNWYLVDISTAWYRYDAPQFFVTYTKTPPAISQCPNCNTTIDQVK